MLKQMAMVLVALTLVTGLSIGAAGCSKDDGWSSVPEDHPDIVAARQEAKDSFGEFLTLLKARRPMTAYTVDVLYEEDGKSEYLTLDVLSANETEITGTIVGYPKQVKKYSGEEVTAQTANLSDWRVETPEGDVRGGFVSDVRARLQRAGTGG
ncbi:MAG: DUF2314 domain-containing protein [Planctomycetota bacterium]|nr:MAG: DUF2314 domain-containing protein [Planctomycetota bacterium]